MPLRWLERRTREILVLLVALLLAGLPAKAQTIEDNGEPVPLQLEVRVKGYPLNLIAAFTQYPDGELASPRSELIELGVEPPGDGPPDELIMLKSVPGLSYVYDESTQSIDLELPDTSRIAKTIATGKGDLLPVTPSGMGLVVNYDASVAAGYDIPASDTAFDGASLSLDARAFSKFGTLRQSGIVSSKSFSSASVVRLDTTLTHSDQKRMIQYNAGDVVSGNLRWTRAIRLGGGQIRRNFALRPDLITMPLPDFQGSAEVPSTLDIYVGQTKTYSGSVDPGPFHINDLPILSANGKARMVLTDANGNSVESETEFYTSPYLLKQGLLDFSVEAGLTRTGYGTESFGYADEPVGLASLRYGLSNRVTVEAHAEGKSDLFSGGLGAVVSAKRLGVFNIAGAGSVSESGTGFYLYGGWEGSFGNLTASASIARAFGDYQDLVAATEIPKAGQPLVSQMPRALEQLSLSYQFPEMKSGVALSFIHSDPAVGSESFLLSGGYMQTIGKNVSLSVNAYKDFGEDGGYGGFVGLSIPFGKNINIKSGAAVSDHSWSGGVEASHAADPEKGGFGWAVSQNGSGNGKYTTQAQGQYFSKYGRARGEISGNTKNIAAAAGFQGAAVLAGGGLMLSPSISDAFAIVDTGIPGIPVKYENRSIGKTGKTGKLLLPNLRSYQRNKISIDVEDIPADIAAGDTEAIVVPGDGSGVTVDFGLKSAARNFNALVTESSGQPVKEGTEVLLDGAAESTFVGYDGLVYLEGLADKNRMTVKLPDRDCVIDFEVKPDADPLIDLGPFTCE